MSDTTQPAQPATDSPADEAGEIALQIGRSIGSIWERRDGARPSSVDAQFEGDVVRCMIEPGKSESAEPTDSAPASTDSNAYRHEAMDTVARLTRRRVTGMITKSNAKTGGAKTTFTLERRRQRF